MNPEKKFRCPNLALYKEEFITENKETLKKRKKDSALGGAVLLSYFLFDANLRPLQAMFLVRYNA
jgi:hypothetical protein